MVAALGIPVQHDLVFMVQTRLAQKDLLDLGGVEVDSLEDDHVVRAAMESVESHAGAPARAPLARSDTREIPGPVTDQGQPLPRQRGHHQLAPLAIRKDAAGPRIDDLRQVVIVPDVDPLPGEALDAHPRPASLRHADEVMRADAHLAFDPDPQLVRPRLRPQHRHPQLRRPEVEPLLPRDLDHAERVRRDRREHCRSEVSQELELQERPARPHGDHHGAESLGPRLEAETAGEQAEGGRDQDDVVGCYPGGDERSRHDLPPLPEVRRGVRVDDRRPRRAGGHVDAQNRVAPRAGHPEGVAVA
jgi:hypothetical protein